MLLKTFLLCPRVAQICHYNNVYNIATYIYIHLYITYYIILEMLRHLFFITGYLHIYLFMWWPTCTRTKKRFFQRFQTFFPKAQRYLAKDKRDKTLSTSSYWLVQTPPFTDPIYLASNKEKKKESYRDQKIKSNYFDKQHSGYINDNMINDVFTPFFKVKYKLTSTRGSSRFNSIFPWYMTRNEATGAERNGLR